MLDAIFIFRFHTLNNTIYCDIFCEFIIFRLSRFIDVSQAFKEENEVFDRTYLLLYLHRTLLLRFWKLPHRRRRINIVVTIISKTISDRMISRCYRIKQWERCYPARDFAYERNYTVSDDALPPAAAGPILRFVLVTSIIIVIIVLLLQFCTLVYNTYLYVYTSIFFFLSKVRTNRKSPVCVC